MNKLNILITKNINSDSFVEISENSLGIFKKPLLNIINSDEFVPIQKGDLILVSDSSLMPNTNPKSKVFLRETNNTDEISYTYEYDKELSANTFDKMINEYKDKNKIKNDILFLKGAMDYRKMINFNSINFNKFKNLHIMELVLLSNDIIPHYKFDFDKFKVLKDIATFNKGSKSGLDVVIEIENFIQSNNYEANIINYINFKKEEINAKLKEFDSDSYHFNKYQKIYNSLNLRNIEKELDVELISYKKEFKYNPALFINNESTSISLLNQIRMNNLLPKLFNFQDSIKKEIIKKEFIKINNGNIGENQEIDATYATLDDIKKKLNVEFKNNKDILDNANKIKGIISTEDLDCNLISSVENILLNLNKNNNYIDGNHAIYSYLSSPNEFNDFLKGYYLEDKRTEVENLVTKAINVIHNSPTNYMQIAYQGEMPINKFN